MNDSINKNWKGINFSAPKFCMQGYKVRHNFAMVMPCRRAWAGKVGHTKTHGRAGEEDSIIKINGNCIIYSVLGEIKASHNFLT